MDAYYKTDLRAIRLCEKKNWKMLPRFSHGNTCPIFKWIFGAISPEKMYQIKWSLLFIWWYVLNFDVIKVHIYSEKATKFCKISTVDLFYVVPVESMVEILKNFVAFSEHMNFTSILSFCLFVLLNQCNFRRLQAKLKLSWVCPVETETVAFAIPWYQTWWNH